MTTEYKIPDLDAVHGTLLIARKLHMDPYDIYFNAGTHTYHRISHEKGTLTEIAYVWIDHTGMYLRIK